VVEVTGRLVSGRSLPDQVSWSSLRAGSAYQDHDGQHGPASHLHLHGSHTWPRSPGGSLLPAPAELVDARCCCGPCWPAARSLLARRTGSSTTALAWGRAGVAPSGAMAWEWVAPMGTAAVGIAGIVATYLSARQQAFTARQVSNQQAQTLLLAQRVERNQRRIEEAYPLLLDSLSQAKNWAMRVDDYMYGNTDERPPPPPDSAFELMDHGSLVAVRSPRVADLLEQWSKADGRRDRSHFSSNSSIRMDPFRRSVPVRQTLPTPRRLLIAGRLSATISLSGSRRLRA
jgi:hypothetical protein